MISDRVREDPAATPEVGVPASVPRRSGRLAKGVANLVTTAVAGIAGWISWLHLFALGMSHSDTAGLSVQQEKFAAQLTPFSIDGMIIVGTLKLRQARLEGRPAHWASYAAVILGVGSTIAGNVASAPDNVTSRLLAAAPPVAFLLSIEALFGRPLTKNLWDLVKDWYVRRRKPAEAVTPAGQPVADPRPDDTPDTAVPVNDPQPQQPVPPPQDPPDGPQESESAGSGTRTPPSPTRRVPAHRQRRPHPAVAPSVARGYGDRWPRDDQGRVVGTRIRPARTVEGRVLVGEDLRADARMRVAGRLRDGADRVGLGAWVARRYDPPFGDRWGQVIVTEVTEVADLEPDLDLIERAEPPVVAVTGSVLVDARGLDLIEPEEPVEPPQALRRDPVVVSA